jgi:hypothetical protein
MQSIVRHSSLGTTAPGTGAGTIPSRLLDRPCLPGTARASRRRQDDGDRGLPRSRRRGRAGRAMDSLRGAAAGHDRHAAGHPPRCKAREPRAQEAPRRSCPQGPDCGWPRRIARGIFGRPRRHLSVRRVLQYIPLASHRAASSSRGQHPVPASDSAAGRTPCGCCGPRRGREPPDTRAAGTLPLPAGAPEIGLRRAELRPPRPRAAYAARSGCAHSPSQHRANPASDRDRLGARPQVPPAAGVGSQP